MRELGKKSLSLLLSFCMFLSLFFVSDFGILKTHAAAANTKVEEGETLNKVNVTLPVDATAVLISTEGTTFSFDTNDYQDSGLIFSYAMKGFDFTDDVGSTTPDKKYDMVCLIVTNPAAGENWISNNITYQYAEDGWSVSAEALRKPFNYDNSDKSKGKETFYGRHIYRLESFDAVDKTSATSIWNEARAQAEASLYEEEFGYLTHITEKPENYSLTNLIKNESNSYYEAWIGASKKKGDELDNGAGYKWVGGPSEEQGVPLTRDWGWYDGEPNAHTETDGYALTGWQGPYWDDHGDLDDVSYSARVKKIIVEYDATRYLSIDKIEYLPVTFDRNNDSNQDTMDSLIAVKGKPFVLPENSFAAPSRDWRYDIWAIGSPQGEKIKPGKTCVITQPTTIYALWKNAKLDMTVDATGLENGSASVAEPEVFYDGEASLIIKPKEGYEFITPPTVKIENENPEEFTNSELTPWEGTGESKELVITQLDNKIDYECKIKNIHDSLKIIVEGSADQVIYNADLSGFEQPKRADTLKEYRDKIKGNQEFRDLKTFEEKGTPQELMNYSDIEKAYSSNDYMKDGEVFLSGKTYISIGYHSTTEKYYSVLPLKVTGLPEGFERGVFGEGKKAYSYVRFTLPTYSVTYNTNGHGRQPAKVENVDTLPLELPDMNEQEFVFGGWYLDPALKQPAKGGAVINGDITLYAKWTKHTNTVLTYPLKVVNGIGSGAYEAGKIVWMKSILKQNYIFAGWKVMEGGVLLTDETSSSTHILMPKNAVSVTGMYVHKKGSIITSSDAKYRVTVQAGFKKGAYTRGGTVEYVKPLKASKSHRIPDTVTVEGIVYKVTSISANAFRHNTVVQKITVGNHVSKILLHQFHGCKKLKTIVLGTGVRKIEKLCFYKCSSLKNIYIKSLTKVSIAKGSSVFTKGTLKKRKVSVRYPLIVTGGKGTGSCTAGRKITLSNPKAPKGYKFIKWKVTNTKLTLKRNKKNQTVFIMPKRAVMIKAVFSPR